MGSILEEKSKRLSASQAQGSLEVRVFLNLDGSDFSGRPVPVVLDCMTISFFKSFGAWALFTCVPVFAIVLWSGKVNGDQLFALFLLLLLPVIGTVLLFFWVGEQKSVLRSVLYGLALGFAIPALGGFLFSIIAAGFESPAIFVGALILSIPSSIGGALAGWIQGRSDAADRKMEVS